MSKTNVENATLLWAVDPFSDDRDILKSAAWCLKALVKSSPAVIQPIYIWMSSPFEFSIPPELHLIENFQIKAELKMSSVLSRIKIPGIRPLQVLDSNSSTVREKAQELIGYAKKMNAEMIVVSSHGRKGVKRWVLGSFAETLTLYSDVPLFTVHPNWKRVPEFKKILFPTDFSDESKKAFTRILDFAERQKSRIILFHKSSQEFYPTYDIEFSVGPAYAQAYTDELEANKKTAKEMYNAAKLRGIRVDVVFDRSKIGSASEAILKRAKRFGSIIAMVSHSGPIASVLMGSTTRQVVRYSDQPVWVIHPKEKKMPQELVMSPLYAVSREDIESDLLKRPKRKTA